MASYKEFQTKLLEKYMSDIVFIELKEGREIKIGSYSLTNTVPIPVYVEDLASKIVQDDVDAIPVVAIIKGLVTYIGIDKDEKNYTRNYVNILRALDTQIVINVLLDAVKYAENKFYLNAILYFNAALQLDEDNLDALFNIGRCYMDLAAQKDVDDFIRMAKVYFEKTIHVNPQLIEAYYHLGFCHYNEKEYVKAEEVWLTALRGDLPQEMREEIVVALGGVRDKALFERGRDLILSQRVAEGLEVLKALEEDHDDWWELLFFIGISLRMQELFEEAIPYFLKVMTLNTGHTQSLNELGVCFLSTGDLEMAKVYFNEALKLSPDRPEYLVNLGIVHYTEGAMEQARDSIMKALKVDPQDEVAGMWLTHLNKQLN